MHPEEAARVLRWHREGASAFPTIGLTDDVVEELRRGATSRFELRRHPLRRPDISLEHPEPPIDLADLVGSEPPATSEVETSFEMIVVDEMGEPVPDLAIALTVDGAVESLTTDGDGRIRHEGASTSFASAKITSIEALRAELRPRWETIRRGRVARRGAAPQLQSIVPTRCRPSRWRATRRTRLSCSRAW